MSDEVAGAIVLAVDGDEFDVISCEANETTGHRPVPTMNRTGKTRKRSKGNASYELSAVVVIPLGKDKKWSEVLDARISIESPDGSHRITYVDCSATTVGDSYSVEGETRRNIAFFAMDKLDESA